MEKIYGVIYSDDVLFNNCVSLCETLDEAKKIRAQHLNDKFSSFNKVVPIEVICDEKRLAELVERSIEQELTAYDFMGYSTGYNSEISFYMSVADYVQRKGIGYDIIQKKFSKLFLQDKIELKDLGEEDGWEFSLLNRCLGHKGKICIEGHHGWNVEDGVPEDGVFGVSDKSVMDAYVNTVLDIEKIEDKELRWQARIALDKTMHKFLSE